MKTATKAAEPTTTLQLDPETVKAIRTEAGLTLAAAAAAVGVGLRAWQRWEQPADQPGHRAPRGPAAKAILALRKTSHRKASA